MKRILYGICGIGNGHVYRQLPIITHLASTHTIMLFAYDDSLNFYTEHFSGHPNVQIQRVAVPYYAGNASGIDFERTAALARESGIPYTAINSQSLAAAQVSIGKPDIVISDYEPISAQYAYAHNAPLITIDQQSKYLLEAFPRSVQHQTYIDEVMRLKMFFPKAAARIASSFFNVDRGQSDEQVTIVSPVLRPEIRKIARREVVESQEIIVYLTAQTGLAQSPQEIMRVLGALKDSTFHVFLPREIATTANSLAPNCKLYAHGSPEFMALLTSCSGIISTAGHGLLSEAMYLAIPVLAIPLPLYEQQMNAKIINDNGFGLAASRLTAQHIRRFITNLAAYRHNIEQDVSVLRKGDGVTEILAYLHAHHGI